MPLSDMQDSEHCPGKVGSFLVGIDIPDDGASEHNSQLAVLKDRIRSLDEAISVSQWAKRIPIPHVLTESPTALKRAQQLDQATARGVAPDISTPLDFQLGRVLDDETGKGITAYRVQRGNIQGKQGAEEIAWGPSELPRDDRGQFSIKLDWYSGERVRIVAGGYVPEPIVAPPPSAGDGMIIEKVVRLKRGRQVAGRVVDYLGKPVAGASVFVVGPLAKVKISGGRAFTLDLNGNWTEDASIGRFATDTEGKFKVTGIGSDATYLAISCSALDLWLVPAPSASQAQSEFEIRLPQPGKLVVHFDIGGNEPARIVVRPVAAKISHADERGQVSPDVFSAPSNDNKAGVVYGRDGMVIPGSEVAFDILPPCEYVVERFKQFKSVYGVVTTAQFEPTIVKIDPGKSATVDIARPKGAAVSGQVIGLDRPDMRKVTPARVFVTVERAVETGGSRPPHDNTQNPYFDTIDAGTIFQNGDAPDGKFTTEPLPPGKYRITANIFDDSRSDLTTLDTPPLFAGEALVTVPDEGEPPPVKIELQKRDRSATTAPPPSKPSQAAPPPKESREKPNPLPELKSNESEVPVQKTKTQEHGKRAQLVLAVQKKPGAGSDDHLPEELGERIKKLPHVKKVSGWLMDYTPIDPLVNASVMLMGWPPDSIVLENWKFLSGRFPQAEERHKIVVGKEFAAKLSLKAGDTIGLYGNTVEVVGVFESAYPAENDGIYMLLSDLQEITKRPHQVTSFAVSVDIPQDGSPGHEVQAAELRKYIEALGDGIVAFVAPDPPAPPAQITAKPGRLGSVETERAVGAAIQWLCAPSNPRSSFRSNSSESARRGGVEQRPSGGSWRSHLETSAREER